MAHVIMLAHLVELSQSEDLSWLGTFCKSYLGVCGFFVISGFLVAKSLSKTPDLKVYFMKRTKRILPAYVVVILLSVLFLSLFSTLSFTAYFSSKETYSYTFWNLIFLNFMQPVLPGVFLENPYPFINGSLWTMKIEEGFYLILPLLFLFLTKLKNKNLGLFLIYVLSIAYSYVMLEIFDKPLLEKQLPGKLSLFVVGIYIFMNFEYFIKHKWRYLMISVLLLVLQFTYFDFSVIFPFAFGVIILFLAYSLPFTESFSKKADYTYGIYLFHFPIIQVLVHYKLFEKYNPYLVLLFMLLLVYTCAYLSWHLIEKRFLNRL